MGLMDDLDYIVSVRNLQEYNELMSLLERNGYTWSSGKKLAGSTLNFNENEESTCIYIYDTKKVLYGSLQFIPSERKEKLITFYDYMKKESKVNLNSKLIQAIKTVTANG